MHLGGRGFDEAAIATMGRARVQSTGQLDRAGRHAAQEHDAAFLLVHGARFHHAAVVHHTGQQRITRTRAHQHLATVGTQHTPIVSQCIDGAGINLHAEQAIAAELQRDSIARAQRDRAHARNDAALVIHTLSQQRHGAAVSRVDHAQIHHAARTIA